MNEIKPLTKPGVHEIFLKYFKKFSFSKDSKILDLGAGHGAMTKKLYEKGYNVSACDMFPEIFEFNEIKCDKADITSRLPYADNTFDIVIAIEVIEHITDHDTFISESSRILKPGGCLLLSTPNILSLKSRIRFLFRGFFYSFDPLEINNYDGLQHVASLTLDQYNYIAVKNGFKEAEYDIDKKQNSSVLLLVLIYPFIWFNMVVLNMPRMHNMKKLLLGRKLFLNFKNNKLIPSL
jgi:ubiquinone/menaquinone biosynthesis C-methylase UbiE